MRSGTQYLWVDEDKIHGSLDFLELWAIDYPEESLSARRGQQKWGWLNRGLFRQEFHEITQQSIPHE
jgi:hypothetical protein